MKYDDKRKILDSAVEQHIIAGIGASNPDIRCYGVLYIFLDGAGWLDRACNFRSTILNSYRASYSDAVRVASEKLR